MMRLRFQLTVLAVALIALLAAFPAAAQCDDGREGVLSDAFLGTTAVEWRMLVEHRAVTLTVSAPCGLVVDRTYNEGESPFFDVREIPAADPDGTYHWSLRINPHVDPAVEKELAAAHASGDDGRDLEYQMRQKGLLPAEPTLQSGTFTVFRGSIVPPDQQEEGAGGKLTAGVRPASTADHCPVTTAPATRLGTIVPAVDRGGSTREVAAAAETPRRITAEDVVHNDDLIIIGSACIGFDCVNGESFSFDTIRMKENNLRIKFQDTSTATGFPTADWQLTANDSASGGASKFSIEETSGGLVPFTVRGGAPTNSLFVASTGRVGLRTSSPILDLHIANGNTPGIRLEQTAASGFTAQTWDIAGNEANFFVRDVTGGSRLPLRIRPGAPTSAIDIENTGDVGFGTTSPDGAIHIVRNGNGTGSTSAKVIFQDSTNTTNDVIGFFSFRKGTSTTNTAVVTALSRGAGNETDLLFGTAGAAGAASTRMVIQNDGDVGIGLTSPASKLHVDGGDIRVSNGSFIDDGTTLNVPDYVFEPGYRLMPISELARFIDQNRHLPAVPSAKEIAANGLNVSQFQMRLLEKIEELTLYTLSQQETIESLEARLQELTSPSADEN